MEVYPFLSLVNWEWCIRCLVRRLGWRIDLKVRERTSHNYTLTVSVSRWEKILFLIFFLPLLDVGDRQNHMCQVVENLTRPIQLQCIDIYHPAPDILLYSFYNSLVTFMLHFYILSNLVFHLVRIEVYISHSLTQYLQYTFICNWIMTFHVTGNRNIVSIT